MYGDALSKHLPIGIYEWVDRYTGTSSNPNTNRLFYDQNAIMNLQDDGEQGYIFEVDLDYPQELHDKHNDYPFCAEKQTLPEEAYEILGMDSNKIKKLLLTLHDKKNYVIHFRMLKLALRHGLKLKKVHRILKFEQRCWLKAFIDLNTRLRANATNEFEIELAKLYMNAVFGKMIENLRARSDVRLIIKWDGKFGARSFIAMPNFKTCKIFDEELVAIEMDKTHIFMNKPIIVGMCVLEISKLTMYEFLYDHLKPLYGDKCCVAYTDTDSFILAVECDDFYEDMRKNLNKFDTSNYPENNEYGIMRVNKKIPGLFTDELKGEVMAEFVGLRAKCYAVRGFSEIGLDEKSFNIKIKRSKGIKKLVVQRNIKFSDYVDCLQQNCLLKRKQNTIRSLRHELYSIRQEKVALNPQDDKRYLIKPDCIDTFAWGHYKIDVLENLFQHYNHNISVDDDDEEIEIC